MKLSGPMSMFALAVAMVGIIVALAAYLRKDDRKSNYDVFDEDYYNDGDYVFDEGSAAADEKAAEAETKETDQPEENVPAEEKETSEN